MISYDQAINANEFCHNAACIRTVGPRGGIKLTREVWRRNGATKVWKTRPGEFRIPVKFGMYAYGYITDRDAGAFHTTDECPHRTTNNGGKS